MLAVQYKGQSITPSKIVCVGRNYVEHICELGNEIPQQMVVFNKPNSSITTQLTSGSDEPIHYEAELCFLIRANKLAGVGLGLDLTKRECQSKLKAKGLPWERAKAFDGSALFSEFVEFDDLNELSLELYINGKLTQQGGVSLMMYPPLTILSELSQFTSLCDGDIVMTGTPKGVGVVNCADQFLGKVLLRGKSIVEVKWLAS
ncbi:fumarylacetoacetate hydrolase family protein [Vibrio gallicus]|uniref:fumarylacetoacetate hydrolase family protein n=1 Tax=Vibrio gallicus TaxID=190897 RepID=UPI0021C48C86|nr:fumarylacetoacetate hydrolase family protein [Vibrio gallicus]